MEKTLHDGFGEYVPNLIVASSSLTEEVFRTSTVDIELGVNSKKIKFDSRCQADLIKSTIKPIPNESIMIPEQKTENYLIFLRIVKLFQYFGDIMGVELSFDWKPGFTFGFTLVLALYFLLQLTYTQYLHIKNRNYYKLLETLACYGITISMLLKLWLFLVGHKGGAALFNSTIKICKINMTGCRATRIRDRLLCNTQLFKWTTIAVMLSILIFLVYPIKAFIVDNEHISLIPIEFIFVDQSKLSGFIVANIISSILGLFANFATVYGILVIVAYILNYSVMVDVFEEDIKALNEMWCASSDTSVTYRHLFLRNMCRKQQDMEAYIAEVKRLMDDYIFYYFIASYLGQIICLFQIVVSDWKSGYAIAYAMFLEMMFYCLMGSKLASDNERVCSALQQSNWYSYDAYSQKAFLTLWIASSNAKELWIGPLAPLTVLTGTDIVKSIYTYYNIMLEVI